MLSLFKRLGHASNSDLLRLPIKFALNSARFVTPTGCQYEGGEFDGVRHPSCRCDLERWQRWIPGFHFIVTDVVKSENVCGRVGGCPRFIRC